MKANFDRLVVAGITTTLWVPLCFVVTIGFNIQWSWAALALLVLFCFSSFMMWLVTLQFRIAPIELGFWLFHANYLLLPGLAQSLHQTFFWSSYASYQQDSLLLSCGAIAVGLAAFLVGGRLGRRNFQKLQAGPQKRSTLDLPISGRPRLYLLLLLVLMALAVLIQVLGISFFTSSRLSKVGQVGSLAKLGLEITLPRVLGAGTLLVAIAGLVQGWRRGRAISIPMLIFGTAALGINAIVNFPLSLARYWLFGLVISLMWLVYPLRRPRLRVSFVVAMTAMQFTVFPLYSEITRGSGWLGINVAEIRDYMLFGDFDGFQTLTNSLLYIQATGYEWGRNLLSVLFYFVPRSYWPGKAEPLGVVASQFMGYSYTNLSAPIYGELFADFGWVSVMLGMFAIGWIIKGLDLRYDRTVQAGDFGADVLLASSIAGFIIIILRGSLLGVAPVISTLVIFLIFVSWLGRPKMRRLRSTLVRPGQSDPMKNGLDSVRD